MNSLNKHVPTVVFCIGLFLLIFSIRTFFAGGKTNMTPIVNRNLPADTPAGLPTTVQDVKPKARPTIQFRPIKPAQPLSRINPREETEKAMKKPAAEYLQRFGLRMNIPEGYTFFEDEDGSVSVLVGSSSPGKPDLFFFSVKGRYNAERAVTYLKDYFADEMKIMPKGGPQSYFSRGGFSDMRQMKGVTNKGGEYQAYFFTSQKGANSHMLVLMNRQLIRSPARLREIVDSVARGS